MVEVKWQFLGRTRGDDTPTRLYGASVRRYTLTVRELSPLWEPYGQPDRGWAWEITRTPLKTPVATGHVARSVLRAFKEAEAELRRQMRKDQKR